MSAVLTAPAVSVRGVRRTFGEREVLRGLELDLQPGEFVALLGRSGSGKSTLLRALAGLDPAVEGEITVPVARSVVFQDPRLLPWASILDNVVLGLDGRRSATAAAGRAALDEVGLAGHEGDWPKTLSGGEAQRAALARALVRSPKLLLLDEPFGALDALNRVALQAWLLDLWESERRAVLLVTHDIDEAIFLSDRVFVLSARPGQIVHTESISLPRPRHRSMLTSEPFFRHRARLAEALGLLNDAVPIPGGGR